MYTGPRHAALEKSYFLSSLPALGAGLLDAASGCRSGTADVVSGL